MADLRTKDQKPKGSGNPNRINRLLVAKAKTDYGALTNLVTLTNLKMSSEQTQELRVAAREKKLKLRMVRSRLTALALTDLSLKDAKKLFSGPTYVLNGDDPVAAAKAAVALAEKYNKGLKVTGGVLEGKVLDAKEVAELSKSKTKPEMMGEVVMLAKSPGARIAGQLKGPGSRIAGALKALVEKLEKAEVPPPAAPAVPAAA